MFKNVKDESIEYLAPHDALESQKSKTELMEKFNGDWKDPAWRGMVYCGKCYLENTLDTVLHTTLKNSQCNTFHAISIKSGSKSLIQCRSVMRCKTPICY